MTDLTGRTYRVDFDRLGRKGVQTTTVTDVADADGLAEKIHKFVKSFLVSRDFEVDVAMADESNGTVTVGWGRFGTGTVTEIPSTPAGGQQ